MDVPFKSRYLGLGRRADDSRNTVENKSTWCEWVLRGFSPDKLVHLSAVEPGTDRVKKVGLAFKWRMKC